MASLSPNSTDASVVVSTSDIYVNISDGHATFFNDTSDKDEQVDTRSASVVFGILFFFGACAGVLVNCMVVMLVIHKYRLRTCINSYLTLAAVMDMLHCGVNGGLFLHTAISDNKKSRTIECWVAISVYLLANTTNACIFVCIAFMRFLQVTCIKYEPLNVVSAVVFQSVSVMTGLVIAVLHVVPPAAGILHCQHPDECDPVNTLLNTRWRFITTVCIALSVTLVVSYIGLYIAVKRQYGRVGVTSSTETSNKQRHYHSLKNTPWPAASKIAQRRAGTQSDQVVSQQPVNALAVPVYNAPLQHSQTLEIDNEVGNTSAAGHTFLPSNVNLSSHSSGCPCPYCAPDSKEIWVDVAQRGVLYVKRRASGIKTEVGAEVHSTPKDDHGANIGNKTADVILHTRLPGRSVSERCKTSVRGSQRYPCRPSFNMLKPDLVLEDMTHCDVIDTCQEEQSNMGTNKSKEGLAKFPLKAEGSAGNVEAVIWHTGSPDRSVSVSCETLDRGNHCSASPSQFDGLNPDFYCDVIHTHPDDQADKGQSKSIHYAENKTFGFEGRPTYSTHAQGWCQGFENENLGFGGSPSYSMHVQSWCPNVKIWADRAPNQTFTEVKIHGPQEHLKHYLLQANASISTCWKTLSLLVLLWILFYLPLYIFCYLNSERRESDKNVSVQSLACVTVSTLGSVVHPVVFWYRSSKFRGMARKLLGLLLMKLKVVVQVVCCFEDDQGEF